MKRSSFHRFQKPVDSHTIKLHGTLIAAGVGIISMELTLALFIIILLLHKPDQALCLLRKSFHVMIKIKFFAVMHFLVDLNGMQKRRNVF